MSEAAKLWFQSGWRRASRKWHAAPADVMRPMTDPHVRLIYANFRVQGIVRGPITSNP